MPDETDFPLDSGEPYMEVFLVSAGMLLLGLLFGIAMGAWASADWLIGIAR